MAFMLGLLALCLAVNFGGMGLGIYQGLRPRRKLTVEATMTRKRQDWEDEGEEWRQGETPPDPLGLPDATGAPGYYLPPMLPRQPRPERAHHFLGQRIECPKCAAISQERAKMDPPLEPLRQRFQIRPSDGSLWCKIHDQAFYPMSEESVMRWVNRDEAA